MFYKLKISNLHFYKQAIVYGWDLWYIDFDADTPALIRITDDGEENKVYNGIPDWVYEGLNWLLLSVKIN